MFSLESPTAAIEMRNETAHRNEKEMKGADEMKLEDYFDFISEGDIRLKGHRIGIDDVLYYYLDGYAPEEILIHLPSLSLEKIYATVTYYLHHRTEMNKYLSELSAWREHRYREQAAHPSPVLQRLKLFKHQREQTLNGSAGRNGFRFSSLD